LIEDFPRLNAPFVCAWAVTLPTDIEAPRTVSVSCIKWETVCVLTRVILCNLSAFLDEPHGEGHHARLTLAIACAQRAVDELEEWRDHGNLVTWEMTSSFFPLETDPTFFETLDATCRLLFELYCLSGMDSDEVLAHAGVFLALLKRAELILYNASMREGVSLALLPFLTNLVRAIDVGISARMVALARPGLLPKNNTSWLEIGYWQQRVLTAKHFENENERKDAEAELECVIRLAEWDTGRKSDETELTQPCLVALGFDLAWPFPWA